MHSQVVQLLYSICYKKHPFRIVCTGGICPMKIKIEKPDINLSEVNTIPKDILQAFNQAMFEQRENQHPLINYQQEQQLLDCVRTGDISLIHLILESKGHSEVYMGRMSNNSFKHNQYAFVAAITLITRSALKGGLDELEAYNLSDVYIQKLDNLSNSQDIYRLLLLAFFHFTHKVSQAKLEKNQYSFHINRCITYMQSHLHHSISLTQLAKACQLSSPYLSSLFKKETGRTFSEYFMDIKLEAAQQMMVYTTEPLTSIANYFNFCTPSNFSKHFRQKYGITPKAFRLNHKISAD